MRFLISTPTRLWITIAVSVALVIVGIVSHSQLFQECVKANQTGHSPNTFEEGIRSVFWINWWCTGAFIAGSGEAITAIATVALTVSTIGLWWVTERTLRHSKSATERQLRAYLGISKIDVSLGANVTQAPGLKKGDPGWIWEDGILMGIKNSGNSPAKNVHVRINWQPMLWGKLLPTNFAYPDQGAIDPVLNFDILDAGQERILNINIADPTEFKGVLSLTRFMFLYGWVKYTDIYGAEWERTFCHQWEPHAPRGSKSAPVGAHNSERQTN
jgi:hypothetical protein